MRVWNSLEIPVYRRVGVLGLIGILVTTFGCQLAKPPPAEDASVLLILVDALRADHVGSYGYERETTPTIDRLAGRGVRFENAISSSSWTHPSVASLFTSLNPIQHGVLCLYRRRGDAFLATVLGDEYRTLPEALAEAGYRTGAFIGNPGMGALVGLDQGFQEYYVTERRTKEIGAEAREIEKRFLGWVDEDPSEKFFAYLHYIEAHWPYNHGLAYRDLFGRYETRIDFDRVEWDVLIREIGKTPEKFSQEDVQQLTALYDGAVRFVDESLGRLFEELKRRGILENLLVVVTSDHGEEFREHGRFGHMRGLHDTLVRVPLIFRFPGGWKRGTALREQVRLIDVMPTILEAAGIPWDKNLPGHSLLRLIRTGGQDPSLPPYAFSEILWSDEFYRQSIRTNEYKLIRSFVRLPEAAGSDEGGRAGLLGNLIHGEEGSETRIFRHFFHLREDPSEKFLIHHRTHAVAKNFERLLDLWLEDHAGSFDRQSLRTMELDDELLEKLKALGYIQ